MKLAHDAVRSIPMHAGQLTINGRSVGDLVAAAGGTPAYFYDRQRIADRVAELRRHLPPTVRLHYALKANPMAEVCCFMASLVDGFDVASHGELCRAISAGVPPRDISFAGPGKNFDELRAAVAAGIVIAVESVREMQRIALAAAELGRGARAIIRLNPDFQLKRSGVAMSGFASQFGVDVEHVPALLDAASSAVDVLGFQVYAGSQNLHAEAIIECQRKTVELARELGANLPHGLRYLNMGGGFGIPYFEGEQALDLACVGDALGLLAREHRDLFETAEIVLELGRYLVGEAGYYVTAVTDIKVSHGKTFVIVDGGLHHHLANSGNFGQVVRRNYPIVVGNRLLDEADGRVSVTGPLCTTLDVLGENLLLPEVTVGDLIVVLQSGAYGYSASPHRFLGHPEAAEILV